MEEDDRNAEASQEITCLVESQGKLLAIENASSDASENHRDNRAPVNNGKLVAFVQAAADHGEVTVSFRANGLESSNLSISIDE
ncbi:hypothetical protein [Pelagicoccus sp. SDUM812002]|uniref:hypothetical protein n=1 Tax=Pelagicoccus sp. SDUM812002 TaxID=3041266 RepID=UPI00280FE972|nr:hypothetical protein [Pelagicoccus sp. SDUM812002]MDQ8184211.1 hypothetical protein [Pelagicoccus sp. SDUM812002]